jgi:hypothetical protein
MATQVQTQGPALIMPVAGRPLTDQIGIRRACALSQDNYAIWGRMYRLLFDPFGMTRPDLAALDHPVMRPNELNWENDDPRDAPVLALSRDDKNLLIIGKVPKLAEVCAPDTNDIRHWEPTKLPGWQVPRGGRVVDGKVVDRIPAGMMPRRYQQRYSDLTTEFIGGNGTGPDFSNPDCFFVIQPVSQIFIHLAGLSTPGLIEPRADAHGTKMAFLINPKTHEGHLVGGNIRLTTELHTLPPGAKP